MLVEWKGALRTLLLPPGGPLLLAALGAILLGRRRRGGWFLLITGLSILWLLSLDPVADGLTRLAEHYPALNLNSAADQARIRTAQAIVILGGPGDRFPAPEYGGGPAVDRELLERIDYGAYLQRRTSLPVLVTSTWGNAIAMSAALRRDFGVHVRWLEYRARDTFENARNSAAILLPAGIHTILLVTSSTHMLRATREFSAAGLAVIPAPVGVLPARHGHRIQLTLVPDPDSLVRSQRALYELAGEPTRELLELSGIRRHAASADSAPAIPAAPAAVSPGHPRQYDRQAHP